MPNFLSNFKNRPTPPTEWSFLLVFGDLLDWRILSIILVIICLFPFISLQKYASLLDAIILRNLTFAGWFYIIFELFALSFPMFERISLFFGSMTIIAVLLVVVVTVFVFIAALFADYVFATVVFLLRRGTLSKKKLLLSATESSSSSLYILQWSPISSAASVLLNSSSSSSSSFESSSYCWLTSIKYKNHHLLKTRC